MKRDMENKKCSANGINFDSIVAKLAGEELSEAQKADVEEFNRQFDEAHERREGKQ